jgi:hypothetical protein
MAYTGYTLPNPLAAPGTLAPSGSVAETNALPPPGRPVDGTADLHPLITAHHAAVKHVVTFLAAETITEGGEWTVTITPTKTVRGLPVADALRAVTLTITVGATHTPTGFGVQLVAAIAAAKVISTAAGVTSATRLGEIIGIATTSSGTVTMTSAIAGETFEVSYTAEAGGSATVTNTVNAAGTDMRIGVFVVKTGLHADGVTPLVRACQSGDAATAIIGLVADGGTRVKPVDSEAGYSARYYPPGRDVPIIPLKQGHGQWTAYAEAAVDDGDDVWVRVVATGSEIFGAVNDTPDEDVQVNTVTPTAAASGVLFHGFVQVFDRDGLQPIAPVPFHFAADADNTATETVTGIAADITTPLDGYAVISGTATLIVTAVAGYTTQIVSTGAGILATVATGGTNDHVKIPNIKFSRTTTAAGSAAIQF